ncbi:MAG: preprotein translocase subunit SecE [Betaproteobacteria bacterium AqS2]|uniref:Protein translocase subunit SecE n=1 Tax=Candidatus Amphirhobacter heronislandensis TaxID=1732024 RepID=A0A930UI17_9GAMM|nr:preprotein translocase subunit SecE [Betaproteobacteria bacterium AqS2]
MTAADKAKVFLALAIALAGIYLSLLQLIQTQALLRALVFFGSLGTAAGIMYFSDPGRRFVVYARESLGELRKVVWPQREEVLKMSGVVIVFVTLVAIFLYLVDALLSWLLGFLAL